MSLSGDLQALACWFDVYADTGVHLSPQLCRDMRDRLQRNTDWADRIEAQVSPQDWCESAPEAANVTRLDPWNKRAVRPDVPRSGGNGGDAA